MFTSCTQLLCYNDGNFLMEFFPYLIEFVWLSANQSNPEMLLLQYDCDESCFFNWRSTITVSILNWVSRSFDSKGLLNLVALWAFWWII